MNKEIKQIYNATFYNKVKNNAEYKAKKQIIAINHYYKTHERKQPKTPEEQCQHRKEQNHKFYLKNKLKRAELKNQLQLSILST